MDRSTCANCGDPVFYVWPWWRHDYGLLVCLRTFRGRGTGTVATPSTTPEPVIES